MMLRLQNKYRNTLKKQPEKIAEIAADLGFSDEASRILQGNSARSQEKGAPDKEFLRRRLENEINALYDRLAQALKVENERLRTENAALKAALNKDDKKQA